MTISKVFTAENSSGSLKYWQYIYLYGFDDDEEKIGNLYLGMAEDWRMNTFKNPNGTEDDQQLRPYQIYHGPIKTEVGYVQSLDLSIDPEFVFAIKTSTLDDTYNFEMIFEKPINPYTKVELSACDLYNIYFHILDSSMKIPLFFQMFFEEQFHFTVFTIKNETFLQKLALKSYVFNEPNPSMKLYNAVCEMVDENPFTNRMKISICHHRK